MTTVSIRISNSNDAPFFVQVDPWADLYVVGKGEAVEIVAESETTAPEFRIEEYQDSRIVTVCHSSEYFILRDGRRIHRMEYEHNIVA